LKVIKVTKYDQQNVGLPTMKVDNG